MAMPWLAGKPHSGHVPGLWGFQAAQTLFFAPAWTQADPLIAR
jgi:hypothetical protein